jgi:hypothetical protein
MTSRTQAAEDLRLAVGFSDDWVLRKAFFVLGIPILFILLTWLGRMDILSESFSRTTRWMPLAAVLGMLLSLSDWRQTRKHCREYAEIETARRAACRSWSLGVSLELYKARRRHRGRLLWDSVIFLIPASMIALLGVLSARFFGGVVLLAVLFGTELICWRLLWRPRLLQRAAASESCSGTSPDPNRC